jgi:hypothetical protein
MRSDEEILADLSRVLKEGIEDGSIHFNPPPANYLKELLDDEQGECGQPQRSRQEGASDYDSK